MMGTSSAVGHGTATKKNATGNAKWRTHPAPAGPTYHRYKRVSVATEAAWIHPSSRHSGDAISKRRTGKRRKSAVIPMNAAIQFLLQRRSVAGSLFPAPRLRPASSAGAGG